MTHILFIVLHLSVRLKSGGIMAENDFSRWYRSVPEITRYWFSGTVVLPMLVRFRLLDSYWLFLDYDLIWRIVTALFYYPITPQTGFHYSLKLETDAFRDKKADYLFMLIFNWLSATVIAFFCNIPILPEPMILSILYVWCQLNKDMIVPFWFGTYFKALYLPWALMFFNMILRGGGFNELVGILVGHLYFFLAIKYPQEFGGRSERLFPSRQGFRAFGQNGGVRGRNDSSDQHRWGRGYAVGGN
ncbi:putative derlin-1.1 [Trichinella spiralis]|uniref:putative derlin-1.1 n=1 Tax=Trichinella spiralis TaxID=6334 RepID=UPI0001EFD968|nr:putative derlin-1.1 [Trichinella spiralis]